MGVDFSRKIVLWLADYLISIEDRRQTPISFFQSADGVTDFSRKIATSGGNTFDQKKMRPA